MTHKKYFSNNLYVKKECHKQTSNCGHNSIFAETEEKNTWTEWVKRCGQTEHRITATP